MSDRVSAEREALKSLMELLDMAEKCRKKYEKAHMMLPEPLKRVLGLDGSAHRQTHGIMTSAPSQARRPEIAEPGWISVETPSATATSVALAVLRANRNPMTARDLANRVRTHLPTTSDGTVANICTRLGGTVIERTEEGWKLTNPDSAPVIHDGRLWGPPEIFLKMDVAAHRREAIIKILASFPSGLQVTQLQEQLERCEWLHAPVSKELVQDDIEKLANEGKVRRRGASRKWEVSPRGEAQ